MLNKRSIFLFLTVTMGFLFNQGYKYTFLIQYCLMLMLIFPFLTFTKIQSKIIYWHMIKIFFSMVLIAFTSFYFLSWINHDLAMVGFIIGFMPTATAAPTIAHLLGNNVSYISLAVISTNALVAITIPLLLPLVTDLPISVLKMSYKTGLIIGIPLVIAQGIRFYLPNLAHYLLTKKSIAFYLWLVLLYLASAKASHHLATTAVAPVLVITIGFIALLFCWINFSLGQQIGGKHYYREASQALGQKNTLFMTWIALTFINPLVALGPIFYLLFQNIYNAYLLTHSHPPVD